jgi:hypothetical protein
MCISCDVTFDESRPLSSALLLGLLGGGYILSHVT